VEDESNNTTDTVALRATEREGSRRRFAASGLVPLPSATDVLLTPRVKGKLKALAPGSSPIVAEILDRLVGRRRPPVLPLLREPFEQFRLTPPARSFEVREVRDCDSESSSRASASCACEEPAGPDKSNAATQRRAFAPRLALANESQRGRIDFDSRYQRCLDLVDTTAADYACSGSKHPSRQASPSHDGGPTQAATATAFKS